MKLLNDILKIARAPELRIFWIFLPFLAAVFFINLFALDSYFLIAISGGLLLSAALIGFFYATSLAHSNKAVTIGQGELQSIIFGLEDALLLYDSDFKILFFNPAAERLFALAASDIVGRAVGPGDVQNPSRRLLTQVVFPSLAPIMVARSEAGTYPQVVDLSFTDPDMEFRVKTDAINDVEGKLIGFMKIVRDRTRDVAILRSKSEFITVASHQLRTPLTGLNWALETLNKDESLGETNHMIVAQAAEAGQQLLGIVEDLLMVSKIEEGRFGYTFQPLNIVDFINKILGGIVPRARDVGVSVYFDYPKEEGAIPPVLADHDKLTMLVQNLLDNAVRYNVKNGEIFVKIEKQRDPYVEISIKDTGIGIPPEAQEKLFSKFYRADNALKFQTEGSGLGLYIAKNIVRAHGGKIWVESQMNRGTIFHFTLATDIKLVPPKEIPLEF